MDYKVELNRAALVGFHPKKATRTLKGEESEPPKMVLVIEVELDTIEGHMRDLIGVYRYGGRLGIADGPGVALNFPTRAEQRKLWETESPPAPTRDPGDAGGGGTVTPIGNRPRGKTQEG